MFPFLFQRRRGLWYTSLSLRPRGPGRPPLGQGQHPGTADARVLNAPRSASREPAPKSIRRPKTFFRQPVGLRLHLTPPTLLPPFFPDPPSTHHTTSTPLAPIHAIAPGQPQQPVAPIAPISHIPQLRTPTIVERPIPLRVVPSSCPTHLLMHTLHPPRNPSHRRYNGFGRRDINHSLQFNTPSPQYLFHCAWDFLTPTDRGKVCNASPVMQQYAVLREQAAGTDLSPLLVPRQPPDELPIDEHRAHLLACAFLRFNCDYGDLIRWLEGIYQHPSRLGHSFCPF
jgi:hypothetical protein